MPAKGTERSVTTGRFQEAKFNCPPSGDESWKAKVASVPSSAIGLLHTQWRLHGSGPSQLGWKFMPLRGETATTNFDSRHFPIVQP